MNCEAHPVDEGVGGGEGRPTRDCGSSVGPVVNINTPTEILRSVSQCRQIFFSFFLFRVFCPLSSSSFFMSCLLYHCFVCASFSSLFHFGSLSGHSSH